MTATQAEKSTTMRAYVAGTAALALAGCMTEAPEHKTDRIQTQPRFAYDRAVAADVLAITEGMAAAQGRARLSRLLRRANPTD